MRRTGQSSPMLWGGSTRGVWLALPLALPLALRRCPALPLPRRFEAFFKSISTLDATAAAPLHVAMFTLLNHLSTDTGVHVRGSA